MSVKPRNVYSLFNISSMFEDHPYHRYLGSRKIKKEIKKRGGKVRIVAHIHSNVEKKMFDFLLHASLTFSLMIRRHGALGLTSSSLAVC